MAIIKNLSEEDLDKISGGAIVEHPVSGGTYWVIVEDSHGSCRYAYPTEAAAKYKAPSWGVSDEVISIEEYKKRFKRDFKY